MARCTGTLALATLLVALASIGAAQAVRRERVAVSGEAVATTVEGSLRGSETVEYQVGAVAGDTVALDLRAGNPQAYFDVFAPGEPPSEAPPLFSGARGGRQFSGTLTETGDYTVRISLASAAARRAETADYSLAVEVTGGEAGAGAAAPAEAAPPAIRSGMSGQLQCSAAGAPTAPCRYRVVGGGGTATVIVALPAGGERSITFVGGQPVASNRAGALISASRQGATSIVSIGDESYAVPDIAARGR